MTLLTFGSPTLRLSGLHQALAAGGLTPTTQEATRSAQTHTVGERSDQ